LGKKNKKKKLNEGKKKGKKGRNEKKETKRENGIFDALSSKKSA